MPWGATTGVRLTEFQRDSFDESEELKPNQPPTHIRWKFKRDASGNIMRDARGKPLTYVACR